MVWQFIEVFKKIAGNGVEDDDWTDRLSRRQTIIILLIFCILVGSSQFVGSPISCWCPAHFSGSMTSYANSICWIANTYYVPLADNSKLPGPNDAKEFRINYYQWVPFILVTMAFLFYVPFAIWRLLSKHHSIHTKSVMKIITSMDQTSSESREKSINTICKIIDRSIEVNRDWKDLSCLGVLRNFINRKTGGSYIVRIYMATKVLYILNVVGQLFALNYFLYSRNIIFGYEFLTDIINGRDFWESSRFPRVTMCDFTIRTLGENNHRNTIQCTLPINLFNEKIFIFIWFWYALVSIISIYTTFFWLLDFSVKSRLQFIRRYLNVRDERRRNTNDLDKDKRLRDFVLNYLRQDGVFLLRIVKKNTNDLIVGELITSLWDLYKRNNRFIQPNGKYSSTELRESEKNIIVNESPLLQQNDFNYNH
jgi:innexin